MHSRGATRALFGGIGKTEGEEMDKKRVLVVDDESDYLKVISTRLEQAGYEVEMAQDGKEALSKIRTARPDAVLLDIMMPRMDGLETLRIIRKRDKTLPVFMLTAHSNEERFEEARSLNVSGFIVKGTNFGERVADFTNALRLISKFQGSGSPSRRDELSSKDPEAQ